MVLPNHPFIKYCIDHLGEKINKYQYFGKHLHVMFSTGPAFLTNMLNNYGKIKNLYILTKQEYSGDCSLCNENTCKGGTYFRHIPGNSWHEIDSTIYNFLLCNKKKILSGILICLVIFVLCNQKKTRKSMNYLKNYFIKLKIL